jgi:hypothetical protein
MGVELRSQFDVGDLRSRLWVVRVRSQFDFEIYAIAFMGVELRSQFDIGEICDRIYG